MLQQKQSVAVVCSILSLWKKTVLLNVVNDSSCPHASRFCLGEKDSDPLNQILLGHRIRWRQESPSRLRACPRCTIPLPDIVLSIEAKWCNLVPSEYRICHCFILPNSVSVCESVCAHVCVSLCVCVCANVRYKGGTVEHNLDAQFDSLKGH